MTDLYATAGVDYDLLDPGKREAIAAAIATSPLLAQHGGASVDTSRGSSAYVFTLGDRTLAFVLECLGTKAMITRQVEEQLGESRWSDTAQDTVAAIVGDLCSVGALPLVVSAYFATGGGSWYGVPGRHKALVAGWRRACEIAGATWGGGESPSLSGLVSDGEIDLAGSAVGYVPEGRRAILGDDLAPGDEIVLLSSTGLHANGASMARKVARELPNGYATRLPSGRMFGSALLDASAIYVPFVAELVRTNVPVTYLRPHRPRPAKNHARQAADDVPYHGAPIRAGGAHILGRARRARPAGRVRYVQHGCRLCRLLPPRLR